MRNIPNTREARIVGLQEADFVEQQQAGVHRLALEAPLEDFFMGGKFSSFTDLNLQLQQWLSRVNSSIHGTTHEVPAERLKLEAFNKINEVRAYIVTKEESRKRLLAI